MKTKPNGYMQLFPYLLLVFLDWRDKNVAAFSSIVLTPRSALSLPLWQPDRLKPRGLQHLFFSFEDIIFNAENTANAIASSSLENPGNLLASIPAMYGAGLLTSVSPCVWGLLPLTTSYISQAAGERSDKSVTLPTITFSAGLASVFCSLGVAAAQLGGVVGSTSTNNNGLGVIGATILPVLSYGVCFIMGLQLLDLIRIPLPELGNRLKGVDEPILIDGKGQIMNGNQQISSRNENDGSLLRVFLLGGSSALIASPCATPVLTSILAFVAGSQNPFLGALLLLVYTIGYSTPLLWIAGSGGQALVSLKHNARFTVLAQWVTPITAGILLWYGTTGLLTTTFGDPSTAGMIIY